MDHYFNLTLFSQRNHRLNSLAVRREALRKSITPRKRLDWVFSVRDVNDWSGHRINSSTLEFGRRCWPDTAILKVKTNTPSPEKWRPSSSSEILVELGFFGTDATAVVEQLKRINISLENDYPVGPSSSVGIHLRHRHPVYIGCR